MFKRRAREQPLALFYAGDVHGSRVCWKKFVNAAAHYPAQVLVMGGDITGKALIPIVRAADGTYSAEVIGEVRVARTAEELDQLQSAIATNGMYHLIVDPDEAEALLRHAAAHVLPASARDRKKASYPSIQDPAYLAALQQQAKEVLADADHPVHDLIDRAWLTYAVAMDPMTVPSHIRRGVDRVLDLYHWLDLYQPDIVA